MLREYQHSKQGPGPGARRWFESDGFDLVVWLAPDGAIMGFQICYDFGAGEHAFTWRVNEGCSHHRIDPGDGSPLANLSPILLPDGVVPWAQLSRMFVERGSVLEPRIRDLVHATLAARRK